MGTPPPHRSLPFGLHRIFYGWWIVAAGFLISVYVGSITFYGFTAFFEPLVKEFGWSYTQVSFASSLRGVEMSFLAPVIGFLADRFGARLIVFWGLVTVAVGLLLLSLTNTLWTFYAAFILIGFGGGGCTTLVLTGVVANWFQRDIGKAVAVLASGYGASGAMVPLIVALIDTTGWRTALVILGIGTFLIGLPLARLIRNRPEDCGLCPDGRPLPAPGSVKEGPPEGAAAEEPGETPFREALRDRVFLFLCLTELIRFMCLSAVVTHIMPYLSQLHVPRATAGLIAGSVTVLSILGRFGFGWLADVYDRQRLLSIGYSLMALGVLTLCFAGALPMLLLFLLLFSIGFGGAMVLRAAIVRGRYGRGAFGRLFGIVLGCAAVGGVIGPTLAGLIFDLHKSYLYAWAGLAVATGISAMLMLAARGNRVNRHASV
jgi:MFS family permease